MVKAQNVDIREIGSDDLVQNRKWALLLGAAVLLCAAPFLPRSVRFVELPGVLFVPGYALVLLLFRRHVTELGPLGLGLLSFFLSGTVLIATCLVLYVCGIKLDAHSCGLAIGAASIVMLVSSWARTRPLKHLDRRPVAVPWPTSRQVIVGCGCVGVTVAAMVGVTVLSPAPREPGYVSVTLSGTGGSLGQVADMAPGNLPLRVEVTMDHLPATDGTMVVDFVGTSVVRELVSLNGHSLQTFPFSIAVPSLAGCGHRIVVTLTVDGNRYAVTQYVAARTARC